MDKSVTYDILLVIHSNHGPESYCFQDKRRFLLKIANLTTAVYVTPALREFIIIRILLVLQPMAG